MSTRAKIDISVDANMFVHMRERGKVVPWSRREGHNVFTLTGKNWLTKLIAWNSIADPSTGNDFPYTNRRVRWIGVGSGAQLEVQTVSALVNPVLSTGAGEYIVPLDSATFVTSTSVRFSREFASNEISITGVPVSVSEAGLFADVNPAGTSYAAEDSPYTPSAKTVLDPTAQYNPPIAYNAFEALPKTVDFTLIVEWEFRF
jgi:hypothetical protein